MSDILAENRKALFNYEILEKFEAGIELLGIEVKAVRNHQMTFLGSYVSVRGGEVFLLGSDVAPYQPANTPADYDRKRVRRLILKKSEIKQLAEQESKKGLTIVPISMYNSTGRNGRGGKIKIEIAIVRGKKQFDKRESIKKRDTDREVRREFKDR
jgi:SsrA-binding protein